MRRTIVHILCLILIGLFCVQCYNEHNAETRKESLRNIEHLGVVWFQTNADILVNIMGFKSDDGMNYPTEYGVNFRTSDSSLIIQSDEQERTEQLVDVGQLEILDMSVMQWDEYQLYVVLHIKHHVE